MKKVKRALILSLAAALALTGAACAPSAGQSGEPQPSGEVRTEVVVPGVYTNRVENYDMLGDVTTLEMGYGTEQTLFEYNTLVLTDNPDSNRGLVSGGQPYADTTRRYELTKEFFVGPGAFTASPSSTVPTP